MTVGLPTTAFREAFFEAEDGVSLYRRSWGEGTRGTVCLVHGFGDHTGRYKFLVPFLCSLGFSVEGFDCRGHGQSAGERGHVTDFQEYVNDLRTFLQLLQTERDEERPLLLVAHSQGGHIALRYGLLFPSMPLAGVVVSSPFLGLSGEVPLARLMAARVSSRFWPTLSQQVGIEESDLTHEQSVINETKRDPLYGRVATARWLETSLDAMSDTLRNASSFSFPLLMQQAGEERVVDKHPAIRFYEMCGSTDKQRIEYANCRHEIYNETEERRAAVFGDLEQWLAIHCPEQE